MMETSDAEAQSLFPPGVVRFLELDERMGQAWNEHRFADVFSSIREWLALLPAWASFTKNLETGLGRLKGVESTAYVLGAAGMQPELKALRVGLRRPGRMYESWASVDLALDLLVPMARDFEAELDGVGWLAEMQLVQGLEGDERLAAIHLLKTMAGIGRLFRHKWGRTSFYSKPAHPSAAQPTGGRET